MNFRAGLYACTCWDCRVQLLVGAMSESLCASHITVQKLEHSDRFKRVHTYLFPKERWKHLIHSCLVIGY